MKVDWDRIIAENHKPSRASRRLVGGAAGDVAIDANTTIGIDEYLLPLSLMGGPVGFALGIGSYIASKVLKANAKEEAERAEREARRQAWLISEEYYRQNWITYYEQYRKYKIPHMKDSYKYWGKKLKDEYGVLMEPESNLPEAVDPIVENAKELKEQEDYRKITEENEAYALQLRNESDRREEAARILARSKILSSQQNAAMNASMKSATTMQGAVNLVKQSAMTAMAKRSENLKSLQELAKERSAVAKADAQVKEAIKANSAQLLAQQEAMRTKLRNEALAKQAAIGPVKTVSFNLPKPKKVLAPQVKFGGSKASGYVQKLIAMYKDGLEVFDIKKMKWASDNLRALGIMVEELDDSPAEFPMGRIGLKENREANVEQKMEHPKFLIEPPATRKDSATLFKVIYDGEKMRIARVSHNYFRADANNWTSGGNSAIYTGRVENGTYYRHKKGSDTGRIPLLTPEKFFKDDPARLKQLDEYMMNSEFFKQKLAELPAEFQVGRTNLKENREANVEPKMEDLPTYREPEKTKEKYITYTTGTHTEVKTGKTFSPREYRIRMEIKGYRFVIDNDVPVPEGSELDGRKGYDKRRLKILPEVEALPIRPKKK